VVGGVMVVEGRAYCIAGRTGTIDGGMLAYALDAATGKVLWERPIVGGGMSDLGVYDRGAVFLGRLLKLDAQTGNPLTGGSGALWSGSNQLLDRNWQRLSAEDRAQHWMRIKQGFGGQPAVSMNHIQHKFQVNEGSLVAADPATGRVYAYRVPYIHWNAKGVERNELTGSLVAWEKGRELWTVPTPADFQIESLVVAGKRLFAAGPNHRFGRAAGGKLWILSTEDGQKLAETALEARPISEGIAIVGEQLFLSLEDGRIEAYR
jgi:outer membrane protein assembly factor BamB